MNNIFGVILIIFSLYVEKNGLQQLNTGSAFLTSSKIGMDTIRLKFNSDSNFDFNLYIDGSVETIDSKELVDFLLKEKEEFDGQVVYPQILDVNDSLILLLNSFGSSAMIQNYSIKSSDLVEEQIYWPNSLDKDTFLELIKDTNLNITVNDIEFYQINTISFERCWLLFEKSEGLTYIFVSKNNNVLLTNKVRSCNSFNGISTFIHNIELKNQNNNIFIVNNVIGRYSIYRINSSRCSCGNYDNSVNELIGFKENFDPIFFDKKNRNIAYKKSDKEVIMIDITTLETNSNIAVSFKVDSIGKTLYVLLFDKESLDLSLRTMSIDF
ncbi:hypothetical protein [Fulvivirga ligni]|uniref:hypothetical protein n=1 Tax=Fulvivirga ligni TaxID=2904246 RepID=UPI001F3FB714|nr:hypothetical protein [Fulvivirga ligni]UII19691.1 hypothetical protein LVD16_17765 [Fulvivirga ligni]